MKHKHWSTYSTNPISNEAMLFAKSTLEDSYKGALFELPPFWEVHIKNKTLLDIGVVEHSPELMQRPGWKHKTFTELASKTVGVDIIPDAIEKLNKDGYDVRLCDATSDDDLEERFDVVYIGDVIEHVNDPVRLLEFAARHLDKGGKIIATTPCPFWWRNIQLMAKDATYIGNVDHIRWITPVNAQELAHRANIKLNAYYTIETAANSIPKKILHGIVKAKFGRTEFFTWAYVYVFQKAD